MRLLIGVGVLAYFGWLMIQPGMQPSGALVVRQPPTATAPAPASTSIDWREEFSSLWARVEQRGYVVAFEPWPAGGGGLLMVYNSGTLIERTEAPYSRLVLTLERLIN